MLRPNPNKPSSEFTATPEKYPQKRFNIKSCRWCSAKFEPIAPSHLYCGDKCAELAFNERYLQSQYGMSLKEFHDMLEGQDHKCAICRSKGFKMSSHQRVLLVVDHDHSNGNIRGLLCHNCNRGLGLFQDSREFLITAANYLEGATTIPQGSTLK